MQTRVPKQNSNIIICSFFSKMCSCLAKLTFNLFEFQKAVYVYLKVLIHFAYRHFATDISLTDTSPTRHFADRHFADIHFAGGHFADNPDISLTRHFADRQFAER